MDDTATGYKVKLAALREAVLAGITDMKPRTISGFESFDEMDQYLQAINGAADPWTKHL